ncbi:MAG: hypothetical protein DMG07_04750, partial [Acidobacteria bacterium]
MPRPAIDRLLLESLAPAGPEAVDLEPADWETLWVKARTHCLTPYLDERWRRSGIMARVPAGVAERFASARRMNLERNRRLAAQLAEAAAALEAGGVPALAVKGLDLAERCYGDLGLRVLYDLDLVIRPGDRRRALELLGALGYVAFEGSGARPGADVVWRPKEYAWDAERIFDPERPCLLDLQTRLWEPRWHGFRVETLDLWPDHRIAELGGARVRVPSDEKLLVELAVHYAFNALES